jgi:hypothetical protein
MPMPLSNSARQKLDALVVSSGFKTKGPLGIALVVIERASKASFPLQRNDFVTDGGGQVKGASGATVKRILAKHGITRILASEVGRTSRGNITRMEALLDYMNERHAAGDLDFVALEEYWVDRVQEYFASTPIPFRLDPAMGLRSTIRALMVQAEARQREAGGTMIVGTVMQHLVGAKLEAALLTQQVRVSHHGANQNDASGRGGDFDLGDAVIHVTTSPSENLLRKCKDNLGQGWRPIIVTTTKGVVAGEVLGESAGITGRFDILDFEQFMATNLHELGGFDAANTKGVVVDIIGRYNHIVSTVETDPSLVIEIG